MIDGLLAFVVLIAAWKVVQVWVLKRRLRRKMAEIAAVRDELSRVGRHLCEAREMLGRANGRLLAGGHAFSKGVEPVDVEWPDEIGG